MFKIESYVTPILLSYVDKYVRDFKPANAQVSLWGGGVALHNLVLKEDVLQREVRLPFTLVSGRIHELLIQVPWTKIMSEPIVVTIDTIECVLNHKPPDSDDAPPQTPSTNKTQIVETPPGYMQALVRRIVSNIAVKVHHLIVKYVQDDIVMSLNVKHLSIDCAGSNWEKAFADIDANNPVIRRLVQFDDFTLCLDKADADGKIRFYQEPLLYRCQLDLRILTRLVSANTRRATSLSVQLRSSKLAWGVTSDQLTLLLRLVNERPGPTKTQPSPAVKQNVPPLTSQTSHVTEPARSGSWSEWAWSWLPSWTDKEGGVDDVPTVPIPLPIYFSAYLDNISLVFKLMEQEVGTNRKRFRSVLEIAARYAALKSGVCLPTAIRARFGARDIELRSFGKCVCGFLNYDGVRDMPTIFLKRIEEVAETWEWPTDQSLGCEDTSFKDSKPSTSSATQPGTASETPTGGLDNRSASTTADTEPPTAQTTADPSLTVSEGIPEGLIPKDMSYSYYLDMNLSQDLDLEKSDTFWGEMNPVIYIEFNHERSPPSPYQNPYDNPPKHFEYSDWVEECHIKLKLRPIEIRVCMGLVHRVTALRNIFKEVYSEMRSEPPMQVLTVEECDALNDNLPERRVSMEMHGLRVHVVPWNHSVSERAVKTPLVLGLELPTTSVSVTGPLYPHRVCAAACQMPGTTGRLLQASKLNVSVTISEGHMYISTFEKEQQKQCARVNLRLAIHILLNTPYFRNKQMVKISYLLKIVDVNICGSAPRLQAAWQVMESIITERASIPIGYSTLARDALNDEDEVAIDLEMEEIVVRGYHTRNVNTVISTLQLAKATAFHKPKPGEVKQAWLFSAPDIPTSSSYMRLAFQFCNEVSNDSFDYLGLWTEPTAISVDPLFIMWLAYRPVIISKSGEHITNKTGGSTHHLQRMRAVPSVTTTSKGSHVSVSDAERVHVRQRSSVASSTEPSEKKRTSNEPVLSEEWWRGERLVALHKRVRLVLMNVEIGLTIVYMTMSSVSALDCATLGDAMERHACEAHRVLALSLGRISMSTSQATSYLWQELKHDGPTILTNSLKLDCESFPWKICLADVSCYTLEFHREVGIIDKKFETPLRSKIKAGTNIARRRTVLELVTTNVTVTVVTKAQHAHVSPMPFRKHTSAGSQQTPKGQAEDLKTRYFTTGKDFKPTTLKEFFRGPRQAKSQRNLESEAENPISPVPVPETTPQAVGKPSLVTGPLVSLGVNIYAETPPVIVRLKQDQVNVIAAAIHCTKHILALLKREPITLPKRVSSTPSFVSAKTFTRSEVGETRSLSDISKSSELINILEPESSQVHPVKTFLWFQWVLSHAQVVLTSQWLKLVVDIDDIIGTVDIQALYQQFKIKVATACVKHYRWVNDEWLPGVLGGRVLEARETVGASEEDSFLCMTVTKAQFSKLPPSWKQELHPKLLELQEGEDTMWEVYAVLAPLEVMLQPVILNSICTLIKELRPPEFCPLLVEVEQKVTRQWPFWYLTMGSVRVLITGKHESDVADDSFVFYISAITMNPHPENPICRRLLTSATGDSWPAASSNTEGRQYEINIKNCTIRSAPLKQLIKLEKMAANDNTTANPAYQWSQATMIVNMATILFPVDLCCVLAPAMYSDEVMTIRPAVDINVVSDCTNHVNISQIVLLQNILVEMQDSFLRWDVDEEDFEDDRQELPQTSEMEQYHYSCPYAYFIASVSLLKDGTPPGRSAEAEPASSITDDSGVETLASMPTANSRNSEDPSMPLKKTVSYANLEHPPASPSEFLEIFVTMGTVELSLYIDDNAEESHSLLLLRPATPIHYYNKTSAGTNRPTTPTHQKKAEKSLHAKDRVESSKSITWGHRDADIARSQLQLKDVDADSPNNNINKIPLMYVMLMQPNLYSSRYKGQMNIQMSLFNASVGLGIAPTLGDWHQDLLSTAKGASDPVTGIPPALATMKIIAPVAGYATTGNKGTIKLDFERPMQFTLSEKKISKVIAILDLLRAHLREEPVQSVLTRPRVPLLYRLRHKFVNAGIASMCVSTCQVGLQGKKGACGWDSLSFQMAVGARTERLHVRGLLSAVVITVGAPTDRRHVMLHPLMIGAQMEATWEAWRRAEGGTAAQEPFVRIGLELDRVVLDVRPCDLITASNLLKIIELNFKKDLLETRSRLFPRSRRVSYQHSDLIAEVSSGHFTSAHSTSAHSTSAHSTSSTTFEGEDGSHYYKDDLRSGAFKILQGGQLPMAYQVILHKHSVSWCYPHPRAITCIVAFPLPGEDKETDCVLEVFTPILDKWEAHTYFKIPVGEPRIISLDISSPDKVFATIWRFRACTLPESTLTEVKFDSDKFKPKVDPLIIERLVEEGTCDMSMHVTAEQLSGVLRVDSYFAPQLLPKVQLLLQLGQTELHLHNSLPLHSSTETSLEGYYVSRPLMLSHRTLSVIARSTKIHALLGSTAGIMTVLDTLLSSDIIDCATGTMEHLTEEFRLQATVSSTSWSPEHVHARVATSIIEVALHVPRMRTLQALGLDWQIALETHCEESKKSARDRRRYELLKETAATLEGRVSLWVHNCSTAAVRIGQQATDEVVPLGPGAKLAYRWYSSTAPKKLRLAFADPTANWYWSSSIPFTVNSSRVKLEFPVSEKSDTQYGRNVCVFVKVVESGANRTMILSGRVTLANMLRFNLVYKVKARDLQTGQWRTLCSDEMQAECVGRSVICAMDTDLALKIKRTSQDTGWSGDIPLKECPKENVPWLVKVPMSGDMSYVSVWCRVVRARSDGRILATVWPLYVLHSHLPLDTDVLIVTESCQKISNQPAPPPAALLEPLKSQNQGGNKTDAAKDPPSSHHVKTEPSGLPAPLIQSTPGRGHSTHLLAPGTTANKHNLSFQYRTIETPVTRESVPMHYGVTDVSVFDKRTPVVDIEEVIAEILSWLKHSRRNAVTNWPYSKSSPHWIGKWKSALMQPRCNVTVRYQAVHAGGGCSLEIELCPSVLMCNALPIALTLRAYDVAPLCKLEPGVAISPPSSILTKPFFLSVEMGRDTYVSQQLQVSSADPGRYGAPPPMHLALEHATQLHIMCNQKLALMTMYYELKHSINVFGISSSYVLINRLETDILISSIAVTSGTTPEELNPKIFKSVPPTPEGSIDGEPIVNFILRGLWKSLDPSKLNTFVTVALSTTQSPMTASVPVCLGKRPLRRSVALYDEKTSVPVVITQIKHESRWLVVVSPDPCPQFVVHNFTQIRFYVAEPNPAQDHKMVSECEGVKWWTTVRPNFIVHYSTPAYNMRFPPPMPPVASTPTPSVVMLTFGKMTDMHLDEWCAPVAVTDGEQLLQYGDGVTIKLRVHTNPHSTLLELRDTDENDISASDIRRRLDGAVSSGSVIYKAPDSQKRNDPNTSAYIPDNQRQLQRVYGTIYKSSGVSLQSAAQEASSSLQTTPPDAKNVDTELDSDDDNLDLTNSRPQTKYDINKINTSYIKILSAPSARTIDTTNFNVSKPQDFDENTFNISFSEFGESEWGMVEHLRFVMAGLVVQMATTADVAPLCALHLDRTVLLVVADPKKIKTVISVADLQIDNMQYENGQYDFAVVASTRAVPLEPDLWPPLWCMFGECDAFDTRADAARVRLKMTHDRWNILTQKFIELTELEILVGSLALYVEDAYVTALVDMSRMAWVATGTAASDLSSVLAEERTMRVPLRLRCMHIHPLDLTLTLHTAVRMYIALDQSPLRLSAFKLHDVMTSADRLTHALTVHYLSAAILGAGWVVGGLELLGAPGALAARLGGASGGVKGVASATAAALLRSLSAWAGSLARNLDILAGDEDHARRAAAARRQLPPSFVAGLVTGVTNFAINILGAVGGLAHHPLVGVAVGETDSSVAALRRGIIGALTKPLSATADLVAYAGHGLLKQTGWDPVPLPRSKWMSVASDERGGWRRDCVRWSFRLAQLNVLAGFEVLVDNAPLQMIITEKYLVVVDADSERIVEMIDFKLCSVKPNHGQVIEIRVAQRNKSKNTEGRLDDEDENQINAAAMARVARYTGAEGAASSSEMRLLAMMPQPGQSHCLHALLTSAVHQNDENYICLL